jgi:hypothetical protein
MPNDTSNILRVKCSDLITKASRSVSKSVGTENQVILYHAVLEPTLTHKNPKAALRKNQNIPGVRHAKTSDTES